MYSALNISIEGTFNGQEKIYAFLQDKKGK